LRAACCAGARSTFPSKAAPTRRRVLRFLLFPVLFLSLHCCLAAEELVTTARYANGEPVPYILNTGEGTPKYLVILFPGGSGNMDPRMEGDRLVYGFRANFLIRSRPHLVDSEFATVSTNSSRSEERIQAVLDDLKRRYPEAKVYLMGTSNGTDATRSLAGYLSERIAGVIHTASRGVVRDLDAKKYRNRQLLVHHRDDPCNVTPFSNALAAHENYGTELITMQGGISTGERCEAFSHHGFNGIERETMDAIKKWIRQGGKD